MYVVVFEALRKNTITLKISVSHELQSVYRNMGRVVKTILFIIRTLLNLVYYIFLCKTLQITEVNQTLLFENAYFSDF